MTAVRASAFPPALLVARWGELDYLRLPGDGQFAVVLLNDREKRFYEAPLVKDPRQLHAEIELHFGASAERIAEHVWAV
jgi:hypothetical protein